MLNKPLKPLVDIRVFTSRPIVVTLSQRNQKMPAPDYRVPLHAMKFALAAVGELSQTLGRDPYDTLGSDLVDAVLDEGVKFSQNVLAPLQSKGDKTPSRRNPDGSVTTSPGFKEAYRQFVDNGWNGAAISPLLGGQGMPMTVNALLNEMWHGANTSFALCPMLTQSAIELMNAHGTVEQQFQYLAKMATGEWTGTMCMTEPQAGSDVGAVKCRAVPNGDHYKIIGNKIYITYGEHDFAENIIHLVLARIEGAPEGSKGLSLFIVPKFLVGNDGKLTKTRNDVSCVSLEHKMGLHASPTCVMSFGDQGGAIGYLLGKPGEGIKAMFTMMNAARFAVGLQGLGILNYALQLAESYVQERVQGKNAADEPARLAEHPDIQRMILTMQGHDLALRLMAVYFGRQQDVLKMGNAEQKTRAGERIDLLTPIFKAHATNMAFTHASTAMQIYGGLGYIEETGVAQLLRDSRVAMIYEGTNGIQALDLILRKLAMQEGTLAKDLLTEIWNDGVAMQQGNHPLLKKLCGPMMDASKHLEVATIWAGQQHQENTPKSRQLMQLIADDFLNLFALAVEGWMLGKAAMLAVQEEQYHRYLPRIGFFMHYILPQTKELSQRILHAESAAEWLPKG
jgi:3-(methylthio)propanoyl-CoA dehydrogenase